MSFQVYKFGGASVKDAQAVKNVAEIVNRNSDKNIVVVISAMGKTTNALEQVVNKAYQDKKEAKEQLQQTIDFHKKILTELELHQNQELDKTLDAIYKEIEDTIALVTDVLDYDECYDQIVSKGELISTLIISAYLNEQENANEWVDARTVIFTDHNYREAKIDWEITQKAVQEKFTGRRLSITQGFIGSFNRKTTTLGREGSDFTASVIAYCLGAEQVTVWKDVPGILNADPKWFDNTIKLKHISYSEAIELAFYGASVIHPKTIKPLQNKNIPLVVRSFVYYDEPGTLIDNYTEHDNLIPSFIFKMDQMLISLIPKDFSFVAEENMVDIYKAFVENRVRINMMQNSAIKFSVSVNYDGRKIPKLLKALEKEYQIKTIEGLELVTIRHHDRSTIDRVTKNKEILIEQKNKATARFVMREKKD